MFITAFDDEAARSAAGSPDRRRRIMRKPLDTERLLDVIKAASHHPRRLKPSSGSTGISASVEDLGYQAAGGTVSHNS